MIFIQRKLAVLVGCLIAASCSGDEDLDVHPFVDVELREVEKIKLEESDSAFVATIWREASLAMSPDHRIAIADRMTSQVLVYEPDGSLGALVGRQGEGPGEFDRPQSVAWDPDGRLWVGENLNRRVTIFHQDLELDTIFTVPGATYLTSIEAARDRIVFAVNYELMGQDDFEVDALRTYESDGRGPLASFMPVEARAGLPYVGEQYEPVFRVVGDSIVGSSNLGYPIDIYTWEGRSIGSFGTAAPSMGDLREPAPFEFMADPVAGQEWLRSFGRISSIRVLHDTLFVVDHEHLDPNVMNRRVTYYLADVYDRRSLQKISEDVPIPGQIVHSDGDHLWLLTAEPPQPWTVTAYELHVP